MAFLTFCIKVTVLDSLMSISNRLLIWIFPSFIVLEGPKKKTQKPIFPVDWAGEMEAPQDTDGTSLSFYRRNDFKLQFCYSSVQLTNSPWKKSYDQPR